LFAFGSHHIFDVFFRFFELVFLLFQIF
jgi:hypothetical protein